MPSISRLLNKSWAGETMKVGFYLRLAASVLVLMLLIRLDVVRNISRTKPVLALFVDTSRSMSLGSRLTEARQTVREIFSGARSLKILSFAFDSRPKLIDRNNLIKMPASGSVTNVTAALKAVGESGSVDGVVIVSDGRDNSGLFPETFAGQLGLPVFTVGAGGETDFKDIRVADVNCAVDAFKNVSLPVLVSVEAHGFNRQKIPVVLKEGEEIIAAGEVSMPSASSATVTTTLDFIPARAGTYDLVVETPRLKGELTYLNNQARFFVTVRREKLRVLYISGKPGPEYSFLRRLLKADPGVELVSFVILRDVQDVPPVPENELSLIPFPAQEVLLKQLSSFDLVILEDFIFYRYGISQANIAALNKFVKSGGGFMLKGTQTVFGQASPYKVTAIEEMSPLPIGGHEPVFLDKLPHPAMWQNGNSDHFPPSEKMGAVAVFPGFAVRNYGRGRIAALAASSTWRWSMSKSDDNGAQVYQKFWTDIVRWLTKYGEYEEKDKVDVKNRIDGKKQFNEFDDPSPDFQLLKTIAEVTGGKFVKAKDMTPEWIKENLTDIGMPRTIEKKLDAAEYIWLLFVIVGLLIAAWMIDK